MKNFRELIIWQKGMQIATNCFKIVEEFPSREKFGLSLQVTKAGVSIPSNIAEANSRRSDKDKLRFIEFSLGSCFELQTQLLLAKSVKFGNQELIDVTLALIEEEIKMIHGFMGTPNSDQIAKG